MEWKVLCPCLSKLIMPRLSFWLNGKIYQLSTILQKKLYSQYSKLYWGNSSKAIVYQTIICLGTYQEMISFSFFIHSVYILMCVHERYERDIHRVSIFLTIRRYNMLTPSSIHFFSLLYINEKIYTRTVKP